MEEYQIILLIILSLLYFRKGRQIMQQSQNQSSSNLTQISIQKIGFEEQNVEPFEQPLLVQNEEKNHLQETNHYEIPLYGIQKCIRQQAMLFNDIKYKPDPYRAMIIKDSQDYNDIFGGQYTKCFDAKMEEINRDIQIFIPSRIKLFQKLARKKSINYRNEQLFESVKDIIQQPYCFIDQPQYHNYFQKELPPNNNISFNFNFNNSSMDVESPSMEEVQSEKLVKLKKKTIKKSSRPKNREGRLLNKKVKLFQSPQPQQGNPNERKRKYILRKPQPRLPLNKKKYICLEDQIRKKEQELQILRRMYEYQQNQ